MQAIIFDLDDTLFDANDALRDGAADLLAILCRLGWKLGALTGADHRMLVRLDEAGIRHHFDSVLCAEQADNPKTPEGVRTILAILQAEPHHSMLVSHAHADIMLGKHAGLYKTVRVTHGPAGASVGHLSDADHIVEDIPSVLDVVE